MPCKPAESVSGRRHTPACCSHLPICAFAPVLTPAPVRRFIMSLQKSALNGLTADQLGVMLSELFETHIIRITRM